MTRCHRSVPTAGRLTVSVLAAGAFFFAATPATRAQEGQRPGALESGAGVGDRSFAAEAASGGMLEVRLGQHVAENGKHEDVRSFARRMVKDHGSANQGLEAAAQQQNLTLPTKMSEEHEQRWERLSKLRGEELDRAYMREMVQDHRKDVEAFRAQTKAAQASDRSPIDAWAQKTLPTLEHHLEDAQRVAKQVGGDLPDPAARSGE